jgi:RND family efflux transporter MFP subunit
MGAAWLAALTVRIAAQAGNGSGARLAAARQRPCRPGGADKIPADQRSFAIAHPASPGLRFVRLRAAVLLLITLPVAGCRAPTAAPPPRVLPVRAEAVEPARFTEQVDTVSTLEALEEVQLAAQASGRIERLLVRQGDAVRAGQLLLVLDQAQVRADVARLAAQVESDRLNYQRFEFLVRKGAASALQRDEFRQNYIASRQQLIARQADLAFRDLTAPITGIVGDVQVKQGDVIQAGAPFTRIVRNDRLLARVDVPAVYSARLRPGLAVILLDPASGRPLARAPIGSIDPAVVAGTQSLLAKAEFANPTGVLRNGLRTRTRVILDARVQPSVPFAAVTQVSGQSFVYRLGGLAELKQRPGQARLESLASLPPDTRFALQTPVRLGPLQNNRYPVLSGLRGDESVIVSNLINLRHGLPVQAN